ncbi:MAG TPA: molybdopterin-guanine dinucleotide biosynthesis protein MobB [bacterium]|nr:molybdopterin-guanine dinucleotide biosynthesis protein MobB [bacterium]
MATRGAAGADLQEVLERLLAAVRPLPAESVPVWEAAGRIATARLRAPLAVPRVRRAAMDGYVCHDADVAGAAEDRPVTLRITGASIMGEPPGPGPARGEAWSITTGAPVPRRGDRVVPLEAVRADGTALRIERGVPRKRHVAEPGEEIQPGDVLAAPDEPIPPAACGALAACSVAVVAVHRRPRVALVATGNELVELAAGSPPPPPGCIVNSNAVTLAGELAAAGCEVDYRGIIADRPREMRRAFEAMQNRYDVVLSTGGVSVGRYDLVHRTWLDLGARRYAGRVDLKPGGPFFAARAGRTWAIGLSGTPVACLAAYHLLVRPLLRRLAGARFVVRPVEMLALADGWSKPTDRLRALWGRLDAEDERTVHLLTDSSLGRLTLLAAANALVLLPGGTPPLAPASRVAVLRLDRREDRENLRIPAAAPGPVVIGLAGASGSGKTATIVGVIKRLIARGVRVGAVKHAAHGFQVDRPKSDSARMIEAGAVRVVLAGPSETTVRIAGEMPLASLIRGPAGAAAQGAPDVVLVEGFGAAGHPIVQIGPPKPGAASGEPWMTIPAVTTLSDAAFEKTLDRVTARIAALLAPVPARR